MDKQGILDVRGIWMVVFCKLRALVDMKVHNGQGLRDCSINTVVAIHNNY